MPRIKSLRNLAFAVFAVLMAIPSIASASFDLSHGERFGNAPNEIVDISPDGSFIVATMGKGIVRYDMGDLDSPAQSAILADLDTVPAIDLGNGTGNGLELSTPAGPPTFGVVVANTEPGPTSVALVRDEYVIAPFNAKNNNIDSNANGSYEAADATVDPPDGVVILDASDLSPVRTVLFTDNNPVTGVAGAPTGTPGVDPLLEVPDSVAVSPDGDRALIAIENDREFGQPITATNPTPGGFPGFVRADTSDSDPTNWEFDLVKLPPAFLTAEGEQAQPEFVDINEANQAVGSIQEANRIAVFDLNDPTVSPTLLDTDLKDPGSSTFFADTVNNNPISLSFETEITRERQPDTVQWVADGSLIALANEGEDGSLGGTRDFSIHNPDGSLVSDTGAIFDPAAADYGFLGDGRNTLTNKGSEPEGMEAFTRGDTEYLLVLGERTESLTTWDISQPRFPRLISHVPTGEAPEGVKANTRRGYVVVANEDVANTQGNAAFFTLHRFSDTALLPSERLIPRGEGTPYFNVRGLGSGFSDSEFATVDGTVPTRILSAEVGGRGYAPLKSEATASGAAAGKVLQDVAPAPGGGSWVVSEDNAFELAELDASGAVVGSVNDVPGTTRRMSGVVVTPDGQTVYGSSAAANTIYRFNVGAGTFEEVPVTGIASGDFILDLALAGDGDLIAVEANPNNNISTATVTRLDDPANVDNAIGPSDRTVLAMIPVSASRSSTDMAGLALRPGGELWGVSGTRDGGGHIGHADLRRLIKLPAPTNRARPALSGTAAVGQTLTCGDGTWTGASSFSREWRRDGTAIAGATASTYALTGADIGQRLTCTVLAAGSDAFQVAESAAVFPVLNGTTGDTGVTGATGPTGDVGTTGATGPAGSNGTPGAAGPAGPRGQRGARGKTAKVKVRCRLSGRKLKCVVRNAKPSASVVARSAGKVVFRGKANRRGRTAFVLKRDERRARVVVSGRSIGKVAS